MKRFFVFILTLILSLMIFVNNKVYAQEAPPTLNPVIYSSYSFYEQHSLTREYTVIYVAPIPIFVPIDDINYIMDNNIGVTFIKGYDITTNSYDLLDVFVTTSGETLFTFRITIRNSIVDNYGPSNIGQFFENDSVMYVSYYLEPINPDYEIGFRDGYTRGYNDGYTTGKQEGYDEGYNIGYNSGYDDGARASQSEAYQRGYNDGARNSFQSKLHVWIVPAIIVVVIAGIFVGYRRERYGGE